MNVHIHNIGECQKCGFVLTSFLSSSEYNIKNINLTDDSKNCDILIILGCLSRTQYKPLLDFYKKMPPNHKIISFGDCGTEKQALFRAEDNKFENKAILKEDLSEILPIDSVLEGCPPSLEKLLDFFNNI